MKLRTSLFRRKPDLWSASTIALALAATTAAAADRSWSGGPASYNTPANWGGIVPGAADTAINDNGTNNAVLINVGDPDWALSQLQAGKAGSGAFRQEGQTLTITNTPKAFRLGLASGSVGLYTLNGGAISYGNGEFNVGQVGRGILNINGGSITGGGNFAVGVGTSLDGVTATMDGGLSKNGHTWFEQGFYTPDSTRGLPKAGSTITSETQPDHSYTMAPSYAANNAVLLGGGLSNATVTLTTPAAASALSFLGSAGGGATTVNYTLHFAGGAPDENGTLVVPDWYPPAEAIVAVRVGGRVRATGLDFQNVGGAIDNPKLLSVDIAVANTVNKITSIDLTYVSGGRAGLLALSSSTGAGFTPLAITGYNADLVLEDKAPIYASNTVTNILNQTAGTINITGEFWVGNYGAGVYNLSGGTNTFQNWFALGRSGGNGTLNMTGGELNRTGNGDMLIGSGYQALAGATPAGVLNHSAGVINDQKPFLCPESAPASGTYNLSGSAVLNVGDWFVIGRNGGTGSFTMTGGSINKTGGGNFLIGDGPDAVGTANQSAGPILCDNELWIGQNRSFGTYNLSGTGSFSVNNWVAIGRDGGTGIMNMSGGTFTKNGNDGNHFIIGASGPGTLTQTGGAVVSTLSDTWLGENADGTWTLSGGSALLSVLRVALNGSASGTLNLNGGVLTATGIAGGNGNSTLVFDGGTLVARADNPNFLHDLDQAYIYAGGATFDTAGFNVTAAQSLYGLGGSLTKKGAGSLTLTSLSSFGPTIVAAGQLVITTDTTGSGDYTVADGADLGVKVQFDEAQLTMANLTLGSATGASLSVDLGAFGNPTTAPLNVTGTLATRGTTTINLADAMPQLGQFPLIQFGSRSGSGNFVLGSLPPGVAASLVVTASAININITSITLPRWEGLPGGNWDIGLTANWINSGTGLSAYYAEGNNVLFNDSASGTTSVNLPTTVKPSGVTVDNSARDYTLTGPGKISGSGGLFKQGTGTLTIANSGANDYTGPTVVSGGVLSVNKLANSGSPSSIGAGNLVLAGGTLSYTGPAVAINRGYSVQASSTIDAQSDLALSGPVTALPDSAFTKSGAGRLAYTGAGNNTLSTDAYRVQDGSLLLSGPAAGQTNTITRALSLNGAVTAAATLTNTTLNCGDLYVGNDAGMRGSMTIENGTTINDKSWFIIDNATVTINGGTITVPGRLFLCERPGTTATLNINDGVINKNGDYFAVVNGGWNGSGARTGVVNQVSGTVGGGAEMWVGDGGGAGGNDSLGIYNLGGGTLTVNNWMGVGRDGCQGIFNMTGGIFNKGGGGDMVIGRGGDNTIGVFNLSGGTLNKSSGNPLIVGQNSGHGLFNHSGGTLNVDSEYWLGVDNNTTDTTNNISGTAVFNVNNWFSQGRGGRAVVNFTGGTITKAGNGNFIIGDGGTGLFEQSGGSLSINNEFWIGQSGSGNGTYNLSAGTVTVGSWVAVGRAGATGVWNMSGGSFTKTGDNGSHFIVGSGGPATLNQTGGTITSVLSDTWVAENSDGTWNLDGGNAVLSVLHIAQNNGRVGVFNLNTNGTLTATEVTTGNTGSTSTLNFNGGTLKAANGAAASFLNGLTAANILTGGATIDSGTNVINVAQPLLGGGANGGLIKLGVGTLNLNGVNTYSGATQVKAGALGGSGVIASPVTVASGAALAPVGTLTINNSLDFAAGSKALFEVSLDNGISLDQVAGLTRVSYAGTLTFVNVGAKPLAVGQVFKLFNCAQAGTGNFSQVQLLPYGAGTFNPATGELTITAAAPPTVSGVQVVNGNLVMGLTGGTPNGGFTWLSSTNVAAPLANWVTNSTGTFNATGAASSSLPIDNTQPQKFYRLQVP